MTKQTYTLDVSKWRCGGDSTPHNGTTSHGKGETAMCNAEGFMCCLGQFAEQVGLRSSEFHRGNGDPLYAPSAVARRLGRLYDSNFVMPDTQQEAFSFKETDLGSDCIAINDDSSTSLGCKIVMLAKALTKAGLTLEVINLPPEHRGTLMTNWGVVGELNLKLI